VTIILWVSIAAILYAYAGYPLLMWILARLRPQRCQSALTTPSVSIVMAVHNGQSLLPKKIEHLLGLDYTNLKEIVIVSDGSTDKTAELLSSYDNPLLKTIALADHRGKAVAVNAGMSAASGDVIFFVDIRPEIQPGTMQTMVNFFADPKVGCVAGDLLLVQDGHDTVSAAVGGLYWRYEQWIRKCEATYDSPVGVYGGCYAIRRELATVQPAGMILDDMFQPLSIIRQGYRSVFASGAFVYDKWPKSVAGEFDRKVRTLAGNFQLIQMAPWILTPQNRVLLQFVSHKLLRLIVPYLLIIALVSTCILSVGSVFYAVFAAIQLCALTMAIAGLYVKIPVLDRFMAPAGAMLVLNVAAAVGLYKFIATPGPLWKIWKPGGTAALENMPPAR
jgi:cellulose synthase/poly-beta-1,6-N-acetylglucosamine synthase-like glycosyltransferase